MVEINKVGSGNAPLRAEREAPSRVGKADSQFSADLSRTQDALSQEKLGELLDRITEQGRRLGEVPTYAEMKAYRELVRSFLTEAVGRAYTLQSQSGWDRHGRQKIYATVKEIDEQLAGLAEDVRLGQERQLQIMGRLDAIRGMLVDLYG
jgi:Uncharacterized protein conserved in bacteria